MARSLVGTQWAQAGSLPERQRELTLETPPSDPYFLPQPMALSKPLSQIRVFFPFLLR